VAAHIRELFDVHELFVYWRTPTAGWLEAARVLTAWQRRLCATAPGLQARWVRRVDTDTVSITLMEIWQQPGGIDVATARRIADEGNAALAPWLSGARHVETFAPG